MTVGRSQRLDWLVTEERRTAVPAELGADQVFHYSIPVLDEIGDGRSESPLDIGSAKLVLSGGEVLISKLNPRIPRVLRAEAHDVPTVASTEFIALRPGPGADARFLMYWLSSDQVHQYLDGATMSVTRSQQRVRPDVLTKMWVRFPTLDRQRAIADYLDTETARIDALIAKKHWLRNLLRERHAAVVREELGHHEGVRLKHLLAAPLAYGVLVPAHDPEGIPMLRITDLRTGSVDLGTVNRIPESLSAEYQRTVLGLGDVVVSVVGTLGRSIEVPAELVGANLNRALARVQLKRNVPRSLVRLWFVSSDFQLQARLATSGDSAQPTLGLGDMKNFTVGLPADAREWPRIADRALRRLVPIEAAVAKLHGQESLLIEHRRALITAAVTGELEMTGVA